MSTVLKKFGGHGSKLGRKQELALAALLTERSQIEAAKKVGISNSTLSRWLADPAFKARLRSMKTEILSSATTQLRNLCLGAVAVLASIAKDPQAPSGARVRAATSILEFSFRSEELESLTARIEELERATEREAAR